MDRPTNPSCIAAGYEGGLVCCWQFHLDTLSIVQSSLLASASTHAHIPGERTKAWGPTVSPWRTLDEISRLFLSSLPPVLSLQGCWRAHPSEILQCAFFSPSSSFSHPEAGAGAGAEEREGEGSEAESKTAAEAEAGTAASGEGEEEGKDASASASASASAPASASASAPALFLLTASNNQDASLWTVDGTHVGSFGRHRWDLRDPTTFQRYRPFFGGAVAMSEAEAKASPLMPVDAASSSSFSSSSSSSSSLSNPFQRPMLAFTAMDRIDSMVNGATGSAVVSGVLRYSPRVRHMSGPLLSSNVRLISRALRNKAPGSEPANDVYSALQQRHPVVDVGADGFTQSLQTLGATALAGRIDGLSQAAEKTVTDHKFFLSTLARGGAVSSLQHVPSLDLSNLRATAATTATTSVSARITPSKPHGQRPSSRSSRTHR